MKNLLLALAIGTATIVSFNSCTKEYITNLAPGTTYVYPIKSNEWSKDGTVYSKTFDMGDLDEATFEDGFVDVSISFDDAPDFYENIPAVIGDYNYSANYGVQQVTIFAEYIGPSNQIAPPADMLTKIMLSYAEIGN